MKRYLKNTDARKYVYREYRRKRLWRTIRTVGGVVALFYGIIFVSFYLVSGT